jgi:proteasome lid subunit RPN8/RPN11
VAGFVISNDVLTQFKADVLARYPEEACGLVIADKYFPCTNVHEEPTKAFRIAGQERVSLELKHGPVQAVLHSHPYDIKQSSQFLKDKYNPAWASVPDQTSFMNDTCDWGIVATDGQGISELVWLSNEIQPYDTKRHFEWFSWDCYAIVRNWYILNRNLVLPNFTREWEFWKKPINTIEDGIATIPFAKKIPTEKAQVGDTAVFAVLGSVVNHVGVICGDNELLHIFPDNGYYAHVTRWDRWKHKAQYVVRFSQ